MARFTNPTNTVGTCTSAGSVMSRSTISLILVGHGNEAGLAIAVDAGSGAIVTGWTQSVDFPCSGRQPDSERTRGHQDAFLARLNTVAVTGQQTATSWANYFGGTGTDQGTSVALDVNQNPYFAGDTNSVDLQSTSRFPLTGP